MNLGRISNKILLKGSKKEIEDEYIAVSGKALNPLKIDLLYNTIRLGTLIYTSREKKTKIYSPKDIFDYIKDDVKFSENEATYLLSFNTQNEIINCTELTRGTLVETYLEPRQFFNQANKDNSYRVVLVHNHPSGNVAPSFADKNLTKRLISGSQILRIRFSDHIIIGDEKYHSMKENKDFDFSVCEEKKDNTLNEKMEKEKGEIKMTDRIKATMTTLEAIEIMSGGNPGAAKACVALLNKGGFTGYLDFLKLDTCRVYEENIWDLYKYKSGENVEKFQQNIKNLQLSNEYNRENNILKEAEILTDIPKEIIKENKSNNKKLIDFHKKITKENKFSKDNISKRPSVLEKIKNIEAGKKAEAKMTSQKSKQR